MRIGQGYDVHRLVENKPLILGGINIEYNKGLLGHSDADVLIHAIIDALLGAAGMGDIGKHYPDTDPKYKGIASIDLLKDVKYKIESHGMMIHNIDATVVCEAPKLRPYIDTIENNLSDVLGIKKSRINIKATTTEGLGFEGRGEGISARAVALLDAEI